MLSALLLSLLVATVATLLVAVPGGMLGRYLAHGQSRRHDLVDAIASLPLFLPPTVLGYYLTLLFSRSSPIGSALGAVGIEITFTWFGAALAGAVVAFPLMVRSSRIAFAAIDPEIERAAEIDGASGIERWRRIILPLARGGLAGGLTLAFGRAIGEFGATIMIAGNIEGRTQTMPLAVYDAFIRGDDRTAALLAGILTLVSIVIVVIGLRQGSR